MKLERLVICDAIITSLLASWGYIALLYPQGWIWGAALGSILIALATTAFFARRKPNRVIWISILAPLVFTFPYFAIALSGGANWLLLAMGLGIHVMGTVMFGLHVLVWRMFLPDREAAQSEPGWPASSR